MAAWSGFDWCCCGPSGPCTCDVDAFDENSLSKYTVSGPFSVSTGVLSSTGAGTAARKVSLPMPGETRAAGVKSDLINNSHSLFGLVIGEGDNRIEWSWDVAGSQCTFQAYSEGVAVLDVDYAGNPITSLEFQLLQNGTSGASWDIALYRDGVLVATHTAVGILFDEDRVPIGVKSDSSGGTWDNLCIRTCGNVTCEPRGCFASQPTADVPLAFKLSVGGTSTNPAYDPISGGGVPISNFNPGDSCDFLAGEWLLMNNARVVRWNQFCYIQHGTACADIGTFPCFYQSVSPNWDGNDVPSPTVNPGEEPCNSIHSAQVWTYADEPGNPKVLLGSAAAKGTISFPGHLGGAALVASNYIVKKVFDTVPIPSVVEYQISNTRKTLETGACGFSEGQDPFPFSSWLLRLTPIFGHPEVGSAFTLDGYCEENFTFNADPGVPIAHYISPDYGTDNAMYLAILDSMENGTPIVLTHVPSTMTNNHEQKDGLGNFACALPATVSVVALSSKGVDDAGFFPPGAYACQGGHSCDPLFSEEGTLRFFGNINGCEVKACLGGPSGFSTGPWAGGMFYPLPEEVPSNCTCAVALSIRLECVRTGVGAYGYQIIITGPEGEVSFPYEGTPNIAEGVTGSLGPLCGGGLVIDGIISDFTGLQPGVNPFADCCNTDPAEECGIREWATVRPVVEEDDPSCPEFPCDRNEVYSLGINTGPVVCNGQVLNIPGLNTDNAYFRGEVGQPCQGMNGFINFVIFCDGGVMKYTTFSPDGAPGEGCGGGGVTVSPFTFDCETMTAEIVTGFTNACANFVSGKYLINF